MAEPIDNLASLAELNEATILGALKARYDLNLIYTNVGDILIATNPYQRLPMYTPEIQSQYMGGANKDDLPPHIFKIADTAYEFLCRSRTDQCFVISGESGAGKTETTKFIVSHIMELCKAGKVELENKIKTVNPLLEAFGNAKTVMNNNSSRFGKYLELRFDSSGTIMGANLSQYLLEKSRVAVRNEHEQNFHIFYQLFAGVNAEGNLKKYKLGQPSEYHYLQGVGAPSDEQVLSDRFREEWVEVLDGMDFVGFEKKQIDSMVKCLAAVLHIGNVTFDYDGTACTVTGDANSRQATVDLLGIDLAAYEQSLVCTTAITRGETIVRNFNDEAAIDNRDAMAKAIYSRIFDWIFEMANEKLIDQDMSKVELMTMGVLDIFGFEVFKWNSLEQMCIDLTNEQLQGYFNHHIFVMEQIEYEKEGVDFSKVAFVDNQPTLDLFLKKPQGIFAILDEESKFPKATDLTFTEKCNAALASHPSKAFHGARSSKDLNFTITHYAGDVTYQTKNFLEKNRDSLSGDVKNTMQDSNDALVAMLFDPAREPAPAESTRGTSKRLTTLAGAFKTSLADLMKKMNLCQPHFVRCLKPNARQAATQWDEELVKRQLKYSGVLETIKIRKQGYSFRLDFASFVRRYKILAYKFHEKPPEDASTCEKILNIANLDNYQVGHNKVFMKYFHADALSNETSKHTGALLTLQKIVRGHVARAKYQVQLQTKRAQDAAFSDFAAFVEDGGKRYSDKFVAIRAEDERENEKRDWLDRVKLQAAQAEVEKQEEEEARARALEAVKNEPAKAKTKLVDGYLVWQRNEHLSLVVGPLKSPWKKKLDEASGRYYFKNIEDKITTWVDPRTKESRKHDPLETEGDELPYGWDEAETGDGTIFFINHLDNTHHRKHPRIELQEKQQAYAKKELANQQQATKRLQVVKELKQKRRRLATMLADATDIDTRQSVQHRIDELDKVITKEAGELESVRKANNALLATIMHLRKERSQVDVEASVAKCAAIWMKKAGILGKRKPRASAAF